jgi:hypothetical protein
MSHASIPVVIRDLDAPDLPFFLRAVNAFGTPVLRRAIRLDEKSLLDAARRQTGLEDFGADDFLEPFRILLDALEAEACLSGFGRFVTRRLILMLLVGRLRLEELIRLHPEILEECIDRPIVIGGLPRTGTTHLMNLGSRDPALRSLPFWESLEPFPDPSEGFAGDGQDPRIARCAQALAFQNRCMPHFDAMHEFAPELPHEEIQLMAMQFATQLFEASYHIPSYRDWLIATDQTPAYAYLARCLKALQWLRGPKRWLLKSPQHLENLVPLFRAFPDARFIQTHRDPVRVAASLSTMIAYGRRMNTDARHLDAHEVGRYWVDRLLGWLECSIRDRASIPADQVMDVRFHEFNADNIGTVERVFEFADQPLGAAGRGAILGYIEANPAGRHGRVDYRLEPLGLEEAELRSRMKFYQDHFDVPNN